MNEILQQRIEEAANHYLLHEHKSPLNEILHQCDLKTEIQYHRDIEQAYIEGGKNSLQNQWISVDEALPKVNELVFSCVNDEGTPQAVGMAYYDEYGGWHYSDEEEISLITHWMEIPSLKGGEE